MNTNDNETVYVQKANGRMLCIKCGAIVGPERAGDKYCTRCGRRITDRRFEGSEVK